MYKFNDKSLGRYRYKQKQSLWNFWATLECSTQWPNLVSNSSCFPQVGLCDRSSQIACPGEALNLRTKFSKFLFLSVSSLSLSEIQTSKVACVALNRRKYLISIWAQSRFAQRPNLSRPVKATEVSARSVRELYFFESNFSWIVQFQLFLFVSILKCTWLHLSSVHINKFAS